MQQEELHYRRLLREYEERRQFHEREQRERQNRLYEALPEYEALDQRIADESVAAGIKALEGDTAAVQALQATVRSLAEQKKQLLRDNGYPQDYLSVTYTCPDCKDTGFIDREKCHCFKQALTFAITDNALLSEILQNENFSAFSYDYYDDAVTDPQLNLTPRANTRLVVQSAKAFVENFDTSDQNLLIYGNTGVGKTFLTNCIAKELLDSYHHVVYMTAFQLFEAFRSHQDYKTDEKDDTLYRYIFDCDLLIIDDLGTELSNAFTNTSLYTCLNERLHSKKPVLISTNLSLEQLRDRYSERIFSRITGSFTFLKLIGKDIRLQKRIQKTY